MKFIIPFTLCAIILLLSGCKCPPPLPDGTKQPCKYVGPAITGTVGFQGVSVGLTLWGEDASKAPYVVFPQNPHDPEPVTVTPTK